MSEYKKHTFTAGQTGVKTLPVSPGRQVQVAVKDKGTGGVWDVVNYLASEEEDATRELHVSDADLDTAYAKTSAGGFVEVGINLKTVSDGDVVVEVREFKLSK